MESTGITSLDEHLGGLLPGDNLVWFADDEDLLDRVERAALGDGGSGIRAIVLIEGPEPDLPAGVEVMDARAGRPLADPMSLERAIVELGSRPDTRLVIRSLDALVRRLGAERALGFFTRTCPRLFDLGAVAYWRATPAGSGAVIDAVQKVTQVVVEVRSGRLRIRKAEGRPGRTGQIFDLTTTDAAVTLAPIRSAGRLSEGLRRLRAERGLTQSEIARMAGVSPSAISQAESGARGLGVETLLTLSDALGASLDQILAYAPASGYVLARRDRIPPRRGIVSLLDDPGAGLRAHLVTLGPGETGGPPTIHKGAEVVLVGAGVVQIHLRQETPVMRAGDALLVTTDAIAGWTNLLPETATLFWIVRD